MEQTRIRIYWLAIRGFCVVTSAQRFEDGGHRFEVPGIQIRYESVTQWT